MLPNRFFVLGLAIFMFSFASIAEQLRDPTRPPGGLHAKKQSSVAKKTKPRPPMILQTILISEDRQAAIISDRLMSVGDTISGYRLSEIRADGVILLKGKSSRRTLRLFPDVHLSDARIATGTEPQKGPQ